MALILPRRGLLRAMLAAPAIVAAPSLMRVSSVALTPLEPEYPLMLFNGFGITPRMIERWKRQIVQYAEPSIDLSVGAVNYIPLNPRGT